eukprot:2668903-Lingulodinium_polyedra.AAC.1
MFCHGSSFKAPAPQRAPQQLWHCLHQGLRVQDPRPDGHHGAALLHWQGQQAALWGPSCCHQPRPVP